MIAFSIVYSKFEPNDLLASRLIGKLICAFIFMDNKTNYVLGLLCCSVGVFFFASPLIKLKHVIVSKNTEVLPRPIIIASFFVTLQWFIYGYLIDDSFIQASFF